MSSTHKLSKTTFTHGCQCPKRLFLNKHHKHLQIAKNALTIQQSHIFESGTAVGTIAQQYFPNGVDCSPTESAYDFRGSLLLTTACIEACQPVIYEAAFQTNDGLLCAVDILVHEGDGWHGYEVKSTTQVKKAHVLDASFQWTVLVKCGINLTSMNIMYLNKDYKRQEGEPVDISKLFVTQDITQSIIQNQSRVQDQINTQLHLLDIEDCVPEVKIGPHCHTPYPCVFTDHCWRQAGLDNPRHNILQLTRGGAKKWDFLHQGIKAISDIPEESVKLLSSDQQVQLAAEKSRQPHIQHDELLLFTQCLHYPLYFLDFETVMSSVPLFPRSKCYQPVCFQYSLHRRQSPRDVMEARDASADHFEYLAASCLEHEHEHDVDGGDGNGGDGDGFGRRRELPLPDIRPDFIRRLLLDIGTSGSILVYSSYEKARLKDLIDDFPEYAAEISSVIDRLVDLAEPFRKKHYYHHEMQGSYSIKCVLPAVVPELKSAYKDLEIGRGDVASSVFLSMLTGSFRGDVGATRRSLLTYCQLDTWAMVMILSNLIRCCDEFYCTSRENLVPCDREVEQQEEGHDEEQECIAACTELLPDEVVSSDVTVQDEGIVLSLMAPFAQCTIQDQVSDQCVELSQPQQQQQQQQQQQRLVDIAQDLANWWDEQEACRNEEERHVSSYNEDQFIVPSSSVCPSFPHVASREVFVLHKSITFDGKYANILSHNADADIQIHNGRVQLKFRFNKLVIEAIKLYISHRTFDRSSKSWSCPLTSLNVAVKLYAFMGRAVTMGEEYTPTAADLHRDRKVTLDIHFPAVGSTGLNVLGYGSDSEVETAALLSAEDEQAYVLVTFDYDAEVVAAIKSLDPYHRRYCPVKKEWMITGLLLVELLEKLNELNYRSL